MLCIDVVIHLGRQQLEINRLGSYPVGCFGGPGHGRSAVGIGWFVGLEEKRFVFNDRTAESSAALFLIKRSFNAKLFGEEILGVEAVVAIKEKAIPMKRVGSRFRHDV